MRFPATTTDHPLKKTIAICNGSDKDLHVSIAGLGPPFVTWHQQITIKPTAFVKLPVGFRPTSAGSFTQTLHLITSDDVDRVKRLEVKVIGECT